MPADFSFSRQMFTFWATETVADGEEYFCDSTVGAFGGRWSMETACTMFGV